jgi:RNA polymerase sigma-70 factor (ECF subfamily)
MPGWFEPRPADTIDARQAERALLGLAGEEREVVTLRLWGGLTFDEVAAVVPCSVATAFRRYQSGLKELRKKLNTPCHTKTP